MSKYFLYINIIIYVFLILEPGSDTFTQAFFVYHYE